MYQWGLGLKQDFPLAKRQYDLSVTNSGTTQEANIPVAMALFALSAHEWFMKLRLSWSEASNEKAETIAARKQLVAGKTKADVILGHIFSWESVLILVLTLVLTKLFAIRSYIMYIIKIILRIAFKPALLLPDPGDFIGVKVFDLRLDLEKLFYEFQGSSGDLEFFGTLLSLHRLVKASTAMCPAAAMTNPQATTNDAIAS